MKNVVDLRIENSAAEVLRKISAVTEWEVLPFISASRTVQQREKKFVSKVNGNKFCIWKVPSDKLAGNLGIRYLRGAVSEVNGESNLRGSFALHPFSMVIALIPVATAAVVLQSGVRTAGIIVFVVVMFAIALMDIGTAKRARPQEEREIVEFLLSLFPDARPSSTREMS